MTVSVVVPAYNEARRILPSLRRIIGYLDAHYPGSEILVVDDGSTDETARVVAQQFGDRVRLLSYGGNRGKGYAVRYGATRATGDVVLFSDADLSTPIEELDKLLPLVKGNYDVAIGSRALAGAEIRQRQPLLRELSGKLFNVFVRLIVGLPFHDTQCGFKLFRRDTIEPVLACLRIDRFAFDVELIAMALAMGLRVAEVPVVWINSPESTVSLWGGAEAYTALLGIRRQARHVKRRTQKAEGRRQKAELNMKAEGRSQKSEV